MVGRPSALHGEDETPHLKGFWANHFLCITIETNKRHDSTIHRGCWQCFLVASPHFVCLRLLLETDSPERVRNAARAPRSSAESAAALGWELCTSLPASADFSFDDEAFQKERRAAKGKKTGATLRGSVFLTC